MNALTALPVEMITVDVNPRGQTTLSQALADTETRICAELDRRGFSGFEVVHAGSVTIIRGRRIPEFRLRSIKPRK